MPAPVASATSILALAGETVNEIFEALDEQSENTVLIKRQADLESCSFPLFGIYLDFSTMGVNYLFAYC